MNYGFAKEVGYSRFFFRKIVWRLGMAPKAMELPTGSLFQLPRSSFFASDVYVSAGNVDWNSEFILDRFMQEQPEKREFLDVGAHIGYYSVLLSSRASHVFAFEPDARNHRYLSSALENLPNATLVPKAVCDTCGIMSFVAEGQSDVSHIDPLGDSKDGEITETVSIDSFVRDNGLNPLAVKIDIEGYDILALRGALATAKDCASVFFVEYNQEENRPNTWLALQDFLDATGYAIFCVSRVARNWRDFTYAFARRTVDEMPSMSSKMLFLVPPKHFPWFVRFAEEHATWHGKGLRRAGMSEL
jgi:FkbM family methyltransferase